MADVVRDWRAELVEAYPDLFHPLADHPGVAQASPKCGEGWRDLLDRACARILRDPKVGLMQVISTCMHSKYITIEKLILNASKKVNDHRAVATTKKSLGLAV